MTGEENREVDVGDKGQSKETALRHLFLTWLTAADDWLQLAVGVILAILALSSILHGLHSLRALFHYQSDFQQIFLDTVHSILLALISLELMWTVITYLREHNVPLEPFIYVGIISGVRKLLLLSVELSREDAGPAIYRYGLQELALEGLIILMLSIALYLVRRSKRWSAVSRQEEAR